MGDHVIGKRGFRDKLSKYFDIGQDIEVVMKISGAAVYDFCCFGIDKDAQLSDDRYMIFYNQTESPKGEIKYQMGHNEAKFALRLSDLPETIQKLVFTVSIDGNGTMGDISAHDLFIRQGSREDISVSFAGADFKQEKAIISVEIYRKGEWRFNIIAQGFDGGLDVLLAKYGGEQATDNSKSQTVQSSQPKPQPIKKTNQEYKPSAEIKPIEQKSEKISLKKGQKISLTKKADNNPIIIENGWAAKGKDYDLKALVRYRDGRLIYVGAANADEVLSTPEGAVVHGGDIKNPGELEHINIKWHPDIASIAVSSYSAIENGTGSFREYGVFVRIINGKQIIEIPAVDASADPYSYTLCFGEIIFGTNNNLEVSALEMYSEPSSEYRVGYDGDKVKMDIGPIGRLKDSSDYDDDDYSPPNSNDSNNEGGIKGFIKKLFS